MKPLLTTKDCAILLKVSRVFVWREIDSGRLPVVTYQRPEARKKLYRVRIEDFEAYRETYWSTGDAA